MNKSKFLTLATTAAVIATTAGTFAAWDIIEKTATNTFTVSAKSLVLEDATLTLNPVAGNIGDSSLVYEGDVSFNITNFDVNKVNTLTLTPTLTKTSDSSAVEASKATVEITQDAVPLTANVDSSITASNTYKVKVTVLDKTLDNAELDLSLKALLSKE